MNEHVFVMFLLQIAVMLLVALLCGHAARRLGQMPIFGELIGGILIGPTVFGALAPDWQQWIFPADGVASTSRQAIVKMGLIFFLCVAGLEVDLSGLRRKGRCLALVSILGIVFPFALGYGMVRLAPDLFSGCGDGETTFTALFMGTALSISALPVIARILMDLRLLRHEIGGIVMASAVVNDLTGWFLFGLILANVPAAAGAPGLSAGWAVVPVCFVLVLTIGRWAGRRLIAWLRARLPWPSGVIGTSMMLTLLMAVIFEMLGSHATIGAFLTGVALAPGFKDHEQDRETIAQFVTGFFAAPIYFVSVGLMVNFAKGFDGWLVLAVLLVACVGKIGGAGLGAWLGGCRLREALTIGFGMNARGVMEIILASIALENGLIGERVFVALVVMALATSILSGPVMQRLMRARTSEEAAQAGAVASAVAGASRGAYPPRDSLP